MKLNADMLARLPFKLRVEIEENALRKPLTQSELAFEQRRILAELRKHKTPGTRTDLKGGEATSGKDLPQVHVTAVVGKIYGESRTQVEKRFAIVDAAEAEPEKFGKLLADMDRTGRVNGVFRQLKVAKQAALIRAEPPPLPGRGPYRVAVVDFSWPENTGRDDVSHRIVPDYPPMTIEEICTFPLASILMEDAVVWMWVTNYELLHGIHLPVLEAEGLKAKRLFTWGKTHFGGGDVLRGQTEHAIVAFRGKPPTGAIELSNQSTWLLAPRPKGHSRKPPEFYDLVEKLCPAPRYADLFSRYSHNDRWDCHGDEAPALAEREAAEF
jgi:N6-adenosine-specific RNA methylase IME4